MQTGQAVYFDHGATTPVDPRVLAAMLPFFRESYGNPSSVHAFGRHALDAVDLARERVASLFGCDPEEVVFTGSGTEADNLALRGTLGARRAEGAPVSLAVSAVEHEAVAETARDLAENEQVPLWSIGVDRQGALLGADFAAALRERPALVSVMLAQNETGRLHDVAAWAQAVHAAGGLLHTDAVAAAPVEPLDRQAIGADLISISGHKIYGPKGVGALMVRRGVRLMPILTGGGQERSRRSGTHNVPAIVGLGVAAELLSAEREERVAHVRGLSAALTEVLTAVPGVARTVPAAHALCGTVHVTVEDAPSDSLLIALDAEGIAVSAGSACSAGAVRPSRILLAMGYGPAQARTGLRFTLGQGNTERDVARVADVWPRVVAQVRDAQARARRRAAGTLAWGGHGG